MAWAQYYKAHKSITTIKHRLFRDDCSHEQIYFWMDFCFALGIYLLDHGANLLLSTEAGPWVQQRAGPWNIDQACQTLAGKCSPHRWQGLPYTQKCAVKFYTSEHWPLQGTVWIVDLSECITWEMFSKTYLIKNCSGSG